jgi:glutamate N-acetyltransferase / amino-acid N-acetyltransferase
MRDSASTTSDWQIETIEGAVTAPAGFRAAGVSCGIKASGLDFALIVPDVTASAAGLFTTNRAVAAPVVLTRQNLARSGGLAKAIAVNSGCANACTGSEGLEVARATADLVARSVGCTPDQVLVASTGVIGVSLDIQKVARGVGTGLENLRTDGGHDAALAIMTTDVAPKEKAVRVQTSRGPFHVGGIAKGAGMIEPMMATMLAFVTCDARVAPPMLRRAIKEVTADTFNAITVDGECSTNDCVIALANGAGGVEIDEGGYPALVEGLRAVCQHLAVEIVRGGEGATKLVTIRVTGAGSRADAQRAARTIANSPLVKTAIHGGDPNWGRLVAAAGRSGAPFDLEQAAVTIGAVELFRNGQPFDELAPQAAAYLQGREIVLHVDLGTRGPYEATMWTCDFSAEYVRINADYRT